LGLAIAVVGLAGFWLTRNEDKDHAELSQPQQALVNPSGEAFHASFVVAGRDKDYTQVASECRWRDGVCIRERTGRAVDGQRTDTILYVNLVGDDITLIAIPRDLYLDRWQTKINSMYYYQGAEGLKQSVEEVLGLPIDYYAVVKLDIFRDLVDALGGVDVNIPYRMYYRDAAAGLVIDFQEGPTHLDGADAAKFIRYRHTVRGDYDRIDNVKRLSYAMIERLKALNVSVVARLPKLAATFLDNVETNANPALIGQLMLRIAKLDLKETATLPTVEVEDENYLRFDRKQVESFLADTFGGEPRTFSSAPELTLLITNRSGQPGIEDWYRRRLAAMGIPEEKLLTREASLDPAETRMLVTAASWQEADYFTSLMHTSKQQVDRLPVIGDRHIDLELVLGEDALGKIPARSLAENKEAVP